MGSNGGGDAVMEMVVVGSVDNGEYILSTDYTLGTFLSMLPY